MDTITQANELLDEAAIDIQRVIIKIGKVPVEQFKEEYEVKILNALNDLIKVRDTLAR